MMAGPKASITSGGGGPMSRRSTRMAGTRDSCSSGGSANPASTATAVMNPTPSGFRSARRQLRVEQTRDRAQQPLLREEADAPSR